MPELTSLFPDVANALDIESVAIVEKDYFVVNLLKLLKEIKLETHTLVFAGGTALSKAGISLNRMSEDIDIKLVPTENFMQNGRNRKRKIRKEIVQIITDVLHNSDIFSLDNENARITRDEYRYNEIPVRYPQTFAQAPCLRPFIKLELMETTLLEHPESRDIYSLVTELTGNGTPVTAFPCATILSTQAEKLISMMRRTAILLRNPEQQDDESLVRHIYDNYCIVREKGVNVPVLKNFVQICIQQDIERYGNQHPQFRNSPVDELKKGLDALRDDPVHKLRFQRFVKPMVFGNTQIDWEEAYSCFRQTALSVLTN
ncbi:TPA: nucleotidyl transferase AbiEii/AbiGii toxin family protein [Escherichia coli]|nr:nucleotidyl transferase AbiEii/AbiGii toxin family protein [Escherichia coli]